MKQPRAIRHQQAFRELQAYVEDHSEPEHTEACSLFFKSSQWHAKLILNHHHRPCPGHLAFLPSGQHSITPPLPSAA